MNGMGLKAWKRRRREIAEWESENALENDVDGPFRQARKVRISRNDFLRIAKNYVCQAHGTYSKFEIVWNRKRAFIFAVL